MGRGGDGRRRGRTATHRAADESTNRPTANTQVSMHVPACVRAKEKCVDVAFVGPLGVHVLSLFSFYVLCCRTLLCRGFFSVWEARGSSAPRLNNLYIPTPIHVLHRPPRSPYKPPHASAAVPGLSSSTGSDCWLLSSLLWDCTEWSSSSSSCCRSVRDARICTHGKQADGSVRVWMEPESKASSTARSSAS